MERKYNILFVDVGYGNIMPTTLHKIHIDDGECIENVILSGNFDLQLNRIIDTIILERPQKIIFEKGGYGYTFYQSFMRMLSYKPARNVFDVDSFGTIIFYDEVEKWSDLDGGI